ncbi:MAG: glycosyltransferase family 2 protein [Candidatus Omnitrophota bacterium]
MKCLLTMFCYNEKGKIEKVLEKFSDYGIYDAAVMDDGSTDGSLADIGNFFPKVTVLKNSVNMGAGYSVRKVLYYARDKGYDAAIFVAGNDKDNPNDVKKLIATMEEGFDFVQGSRYLPDGKYGNMPLHRTIGTKLIHPMIFSLFTGRKLTDTTNGFRAVKLSILEDKRINLDQEWLDRYGLEPYLYYKAIVLGYRVKEVPVTKIYPEGQKKYTKMRPIVDWWSILKPLFYLKLGIKN